MLLIQYLQYTVLLPEGASSILVFFGIFCIHLWFKLLLTQLILFFQHILVQCLFTRGRHYI